MNLSPEITKKDERLNNSVFFIEANSFEQFSLWREYHDHCEWEEDNMGFFQKIGEIAEDDRMPVYVEYHFVKIYGKRICFYHCTSRFCDHTMVEDYIKNNYSVKWDNNTRLAMTDAMNFHLAIDRCKNEKYIS